MLTQTAEYAIRAVVDLASHPGQPRSAQQIARSTDTPLSYLSKVLQDLSRVGLVRAQRGPGGGFVLEHSPNEVTLYDVVAAVRAMPASASVDRDDQTKTPSAANTFVDQLLNVLESRLRSKTIADLVKGNHEGPNPHATKGP